MAGFGEERRGLSRQARQARRGREWFGRSRSGRWGGAWSGLAGMAGNGLFCFGAAGKLRKAWLGRLRHGRRGL